MKITFRATMTTILLTLVLVTVVGLGTVSYLNARFTAEDLSNQILDQTSQRVDVQINSLLLTANAQGSLNRNLLESGQFDPDNKRAALVRYWVEVMKAQPRLTRLSYGRASDGAWIYVRRQPDGELAIGELLFNSTTKHHELRYYSADGYPGNPSSPLIRDDEDPRERSWYKDAKETGQQTWSETYSFFGTHGVADDPGTSCATPVKDGNGDLRGVLTSSFDLAELCAYLKDLQISRGGFAFVTEFRKDGKRRVIAYPDQSVLLRRSADGSTSELIPPDMLSDKRISTFLAQLPEDTHPNDLKGSKRISFDVEGRRYLGSYHCLTSKETPNWLICVVLPEEDVLARVDSSNVQALSVGLAVLLAAVFVSLMVSRRVAGPLARLAAETEAIGRLELQARPLVSSPVVEVARLAAAVEDTKTSLRSFRKYVPAELVRLLLSSSKEAELGGEKRRLTIYFCDLADFTSVSEKLPPEELVHHLADYFGAFSSDILNSSGTVDKYIGDAIMAFWGAPNPTADHAAAACVTALRNQAALQALRSQWEAQGRPALFARIGIHTGEVIVGNIGSEARLNYTVMGDAVNLASRLEGLNKYYGTHILISEDTYREAEKVILARPVDWVAVKGKEKAVLVYELVGLRVEASNALAELVRLSTEALASYRKRDWQGALKIFETILEAFPKDGPARHLAARCRAYQTTPPPASWDGSYRMEGK